MRGKIGKTQKALLVSLINRGRWSPGCGWVWSTAQATDKLMKTLERRGLVRRVGDWRRSDWVTWGVYEITDEGRAAATEER